MVVEKFVFEIISKIQKFNNSKKVIEWISNNMKLSNSDAKEILNAVQNLISVSKKKQENIDFKFETPTSFFSEKYYKINGIYFLIQFQSEKVTFYVHPKLAHLEVEKQEKIDEKLTIFSQNSYIILLENNIFMDAWKLEDFHFFQGKLSMLLISKAYQKEEKDWMGIFHASAISDAKKAILFMGNSGSGKSTLSALLMHHGFLTISDDFVPVLRENQHVYNFPVGISIKEKSVEILKDFYPELNTATSYNLTQKKLVRYLTPKKTVKQNFPCKAFVFVKYQKEETSVSLKEISKLETFQKVIPETWLFPSKENANMFLNWFSKIPCYELKYSDNNAMIQTVKQLFSDEI